MSKPEIPFAWMWGDPSQALDRKRDLDKLIAKGKARKLQNKRRRIKKLVKEQMARLGKGQR